MADRKKHTIETSYTLRWHPVVLQDSRRQKSTQAGQMQGAL